MKKLAIALLAVALLASLAVAAEKPVWEKGMAISSRGALDCTNAIPINCGDLVSGDTTNGPDNVDVYTPNGYSQAYGLEAVYELVLAGDPSTDCYDVTGTISNMTVDLDIYFLGSCEETDSIDYGNSTFTTTVPAGTYYVVVDGYGDTDIGTFDLQVDCTPVACPVDPCDNIVAAVEGLNSCTVIPTWYSFTAPIDGCIWLDSCIADQFVDTVVELYDECEGTLIASNDDSPCDVTGLASFLSVTVTAGDVLYIKWRNFGSGTTPFDWNLWVTDCVVGTEDTSWGSMKSLFR